MRLISVLVCICVVLWAERLELNGGSLEAELLGFEQGKVVVSTPFAGTLRIDPATVVSLEAREPMHLRTRDDEILPGIPRLGLQGVSINGTTVAYEEIYRMQPLSNLLKLRKEGFVDLALQEISGNTQSTTHSVDAGTLLRKSVHRHTLRAHYTKQKSDEELIEERQSYRYQYDRFVSVRWYLYGNLGWSSDHATNLRSRREVGLGAGHQFIENDTTRVSISLGANRVFESFKAEDDRSDTAAQLAMNLSHKVLADRMELFHENETFYFPDRDDDYRLNARTGLRVGLAEGLTAALQHRDELRRHVPEGTKDHDRALMLSLGYRW